MASHRILIVEDDEQAAELLEVFLDQAGLEAVAKAPTGEEAVTKAGETMPDLVLMDILLEGEMDGIEAADQIHSLYDIPVVYLTAYADKEILERAKKTEPYGYLSKPTTVPELRSTIEMALHKYQADKRVMESEAKFRAIYENAPVMIHSFSPDGDLVLWNSEIEKRLGWTKEEAKSQDILASCYSDPETCQQVKETLERADGLFREFTAIAKDGSQRIQIWANFPLPDGTVISVGHDITDRKHQEEALRISEANYRMLVQRSPVGIIACDATGRITELNSEMLTILGLPPEKIPELTAVDEFMPLTRTGISVAISKCLESGQPISGEYQYTSASNKPVYLKLRSAPISGGQGEIAGVQAIVENVTRQKRAQKYSIQTQRLKALGQLAEGTTRMFDHFIQSVAFGAQQALACYESKNFSAMRPFLDRMFDAASRAAQTVRRLQQFAHFRRSAGLLKGEVFDFNNAVKEALQVHEIWAEGNRKEKGINVSVDLDLGEGCVIEAQERDMIDVVLNFLRNAEEALPDGGEIRVKTFVQEDKVIFEMQDNGIAIHEKIIGRVFEPFRTSKTGHAGLGLAQNLGIVRGYGGNVSVSSKKGRGTTFTVGLPHSKKPLMDAKAPTQESVDRSLRLLVIDDEEPVLDTISQGMEGLGQTVLKAISGKEGIEIFRETDVDAVVCDLAMPGMNGWEVSRAIRMVAEEKGAPKPPFIILTGWSGELAEHEILAHPDVDRVVEKPVLFSRLLKIVKEAVDASDKEPIVLGRVFETALHEPFSGYVDQIDILEFLQLLLFSGRQVVIEIESKDGTRGSVFVNKGEISHAECGDFEGEEALYHCLSFEGGTFSSTPWREPQRVTIDKSGGYLLMEAARKRDEMKDSTRVAKLDGQ